jgi:hypothetical protein
MKKIYLCAFAIIGVNSVFAQIDFGMKAGLNRTGLNYSGSSINDLGVRSDFNAGAFASIPLFTNFYLQPEIMYSGQGSGFTDSTQSTLNYNYMNIPVLFKYEHPSGFFAETGPQLGFLLSAHLEYNGANDLKDQTQSVDFSWAFGLGYKIPKINLGLDLRYNYGLTNTVATKYASAGWAKNSVFQVDLFYQFKMH